MPVNTSPTLPPQSPCSGPRRPPIVWSIAGLDTAGGAGLSADQRAADAFGVHLCPVVATMTAQHSRGVQAVQPVAAAWLEAQLRALAHDMPPDVIKTGLLGSVEAVSLVARWVDRLRQANPGRPVALVVDPVLGASAGGAAFANEAILEAYRLKLLPRATLVTPNRTEALRLLDQPPQHDGPRAEIPDLAARLRERGAQGVAVTGGDAEDAGTHCLDWIDTPQAQGWLTAPRIPTPHHHGTGCTFAMGAAAALALGHPMADALVLAKMLTLHALQGAHAAGEGAGPVMARAGFAAGPARGGAALPWLGLGRELPWRITLEAAVEPSPTLFQPFTPPPDRLYALADNAPHLGALMDAGLRCVQLRRKERSSLQAHLDASVVRAARQGAVLFINDHWQEALHQAAPLDAAPGFALGIHLGQEDLLALSAVDRLALLAQRHRVVLGLSSHSLWELARAAGCGASLIACGPVMPTTTKDMPWRAQGEDNLRWWVANSPAPVVAIGGLLAAADVARFAGCGPQAVCLVRALALDGPALEEALAAFRAAAAAAFAGAAPLADGSLTVPLPHPVL